MNTTFGFKRSPHTDTCGIIPLMLILWSIFVCTVGLAALCLASMQPVEASEVSYPSREGNWIVGQTALIGE